MDSAVGWLCWVGRYDDSDHEKSYDTLIIAIEVHDCNSDDVSR